jgi:hypothetical protein
MGVKDQFDASRFGIFADSEGLSNLSEMDLEQDDDFYGMSRHCEGCGQRKQCQIPWSELYCLQYAVDPAKVGQAIRRQDLFDTSWVYDPRFKCFHPNYRCTCLGNPVVLFNMTPRQAEQVLHAAGRNGIVSEAQKGIIRTIAPVVKQLAGGAPAQPVMRQGPPQQVMPGQMRRR